MSQSLPYGECHYCFMLAYPRLLFPSSSPFTFPFRRRRCGPPLAAAAAPPFRQQPEGSSPLRATMAEAEVLAVSRALLDAIGKGDYAAYEVRMYMR